ncbi:MAG: hypothetical protein WEB87_00485 [Bacteriovoracaceae bacterium]
MFKRFILALFMIIGPQSTALALDAGLMDHQATKKLVRLSLWYEGTQKFEKSAFRPGGAQDLIKEAQNPNEGAPVITEELAVALENINI